MKFSEIGASYPPEIPWLDRALKQVRHIAWWIGRMCITGKRPPAFLVWPEMPSRRAALHKMARALNWEVTNRPRRHPIAGMRFADRTDKGLAFNPPASMDGVQWWNCNCNDIRKSTLESAHQAAFGYGIAIDPLTYEGLMVEKSDENARHDGRLVQGPLTPGELRENAVYQVNIENVDTHGRYFDYRLMYLLGTFPIIYRKFKPTEARFTNLTDGVEVLNDPSSFTSHELASISQLATLMGVDYAEFDVLRDRSSGKIYVVDINPTPWGPPAQLDLTASRAAIQRMAEALHQAVRVSSK